jgi:hypothetical protein
VLARWRQAPAVAGAPGARLEQRLQKARDLLVERRPQAFHGTELDPEATRPRREKLVARAEALVAAHAAKGGANEAASLADRLREALATNAMGGRAALEARWREAARELEQLESSWQRLGPVTGVLGRALQERFKKASDALHSRKPR